MPSIKFSSMLLTVQKQTWFVDFQNGHRGSHLGYQNGMILSILNIYVAPMPPIKFQLIPEDTSFEDFQDGRHGGHLGYRN